jgi:hypothetical protein
MSDQFVQIATAAAENGHSLYALDAKGVVWQYEWIAPLGKNPKDYPAWVALSQSRIP